MGIFNVFRKKRSFEDREDFEKGLSSIMEFLQNIGRDVKEIHELIVRVKNKRRKERSETDNKKQLRLLEEEIKAWDDFLEKYVMFDRDTDIAGERIKKISQILKEEAVKMEIDPKIKKMVNKKDEWNFNW